MSKSTVIVSGNLIETWHYEGDHKGGGAKPRTLPVIDGMSDFLDGGSNAEHEREQQKIRTKSNARRAKISFRRLVQANLGGHENPLLVTLTYAKNEEDLDTARKDFNAFAKRCKSEFGNKLRYVCVLEFQERGAIHFHALFWGIPSTYIARERTTRFFASIWMQGFVFLKVTDGDLRIAGYLSKYMEKMFLDPRLFGRKAYIASRNFFVQSS